MIDLNDGTHSRFDSSHYDTCQPCREDHLDFEQEMIMDAQDEAREYQSELENDL